MTDREFLYWLQGCCTALSKSLNVGPDTFKSLADRLMEHLTTTAKPDKVYR